MDQHTSARAIDSDMQAWLCECIALSLREGKAVVCSIPVRFELLASEFLHELDADLDGDSESDGPDTIRCTGEGWVLVLKVVL